MINIKIIIILSIILFIHSLHITMAGTKTSCFSEANFEIVYAYVEKQVRQSDSGHYQMGDMELHLRGDNQIFLKKNNYTLAIIDRETGIYSLAKVLDDNNRLVKKANEIFCDLLSEAR